VTLEEYNAEKAMYDMAHIDNSVMNTSIYWYDMNDEEIWYE